MNPSLVARAELNAQPTMLLVTGVDQRRSSRSARGYIPHPPRARQAALAAVAHRINPIEAPRLSDEGICGKIGTVQIPASRAVDHPCRTPVIELDPQARNGAALASRHLDQA